MLVWQAQEHPTSCVAACVRMVLSGFSQDWTETQVRQVLGRPRLGITLSATCARLNQAGATAFYHEDWSMDDLRDSLRQGRYPIVGVERHIFGYPPASHAVVLIGVTSRQIKVLDPLDGPQPRQYGASTFELAWKLSGGAVLIIETPPRL